MADKPTFFTGKLSSFNTAVAQMERIAETQRESNIYQLKRDYGQWAACLMILYKEVYSKCKDTEDTKAEELLTKMNQAVNQFTNSNLRRSNPLAETTCFNACWRADKYIRKLMELHKFASPDADDPRLAAYG